MSAARIILYQGAAIAMVYALLGCSESAAFSEALEGLVSHAAVRVGDKNGVVMLVLFCMMLLGLFFDLCAYQANSLRRKPWKRGFKAARMTMLAGIQAGLFMFFATYLFRAMSQRVFNLLVFSMLLCVADACGKALGFRMLSAWSYYGFILANIAVGLFVFFGKTNHYYSIISALLLRGRFS
ncbi:hypothetical protein PAPHI01_0076 [Pancytospora philotis]|nr:hypothetical protein PAPHI01_0076 [Pancytospora philotis]